MPHIHDKIDFTVEVFVVHKNKVLLRRHDKYGIWLSVGGHVELDEDPNSAVLREVREEVGLEIELFHENDYWPIKNDQYQELIPPQFLNRHRINENHEHVTLVYFARSKSAELILSEKEKSSKCRWFTKQELLDLKSQFTNNIQTYALTALEKLGKN